MPRKKRSLISLPKQTSSLNLGSLLSRPLDLKKNLMSQILEGLQHQQSAAPQSPVPTRTRTTTPPPLATTEEEEEGSWEIYTLLLPPSLLPVTQDSPLPSTPATPLSPSAPYQCTTTDPQRFSRPHARHAIWPVGARLSASTSH
ncbi:NS2 [Chipmunk parvovirus]|uniref:NS2 n=1 Tax=Chipmunk parvovirus TaxID=56820 RepID=C6KF49_9VIRU|nr:NS2 [Chipmunk parvovirus]ACT09661.1 NS2 [Chipmunk parvovirus]